jgi:hypothetical protein
MEAGMGVGSFLGGFGDAYAQAQATKERYQYVQAAQQALHQMDLDKVAEEQAPYQMPREMWAQLYQDRSGKALSPDVVSQMPQMMDSRQLEYVARQPAPQKPGAMGLDVMTKRAIMNAPAYQKMANDMVDAKNAWESIPNPQQKDALAQQLIAEKQPLLNRFLAYQPQNPQDQANLQNIQTEAQAAMQGGVYQQLRFLHALEFVNQSTGATRPPSPEIVHEIMSTSPSLDMPVRQFARQMYNQNQQIAQKFSGVADLADLQGNQAGAASARQFYGSFNGSFHRVHGVPYDGNNEPMTPEFGYIPAGGAALGAGGNNTGAGTNQGGGPPPPAYDPNPLLNKYLPPQQQP